MKVEIKEIEGQKKLYFDDELFDWEINETDLKQAKEFLRDNPSLVKKVHDDIKNHLLDSLSEGLGKKINIKELNEAIKRRHIDVGNKRNRQEILY